MIDPAEAAIVTRIFTEYDRGRSARAIAIALNRPALWRQGQTHLVVLDDLGELEARKGSGTGNASSRILAAASGKHD